MSRSDEYKELLKSPKWKNKRSKILKRDKKKCTKCGCTAELEVHHIWYITGNLPWEVPNKYLTTLCRDCHQKEHDAKPIYKFYKPCNQKPRKLPIQGVVTKKKKKSKFPPLKGKDKKIQDKYDKLRAEGKIL